MNFVKMLSMLWILFLKCYDSYMLVVCRLKVLILFGVIIGIKVKWKRDILDINF